MQKRDARSIDGSLTAAQLPERATETIEREGVGSGELAGDSSASPLFHRGRIHTAGETGK